MSEKPKLSLVTILTIVIAAVSIVVMLMFFPVSIVLFVGITCTIGFLFIKHVFDMEPVTRVKEAEE